MTLIEHLTELRRRTIISLLAAAVTIAASFYYARPLLDFVLRPSQPYIPRLIFVTPAEAFVTQRRISALAVLVFASPVWLYQAVRFVWPGLDSAERRYLLLLLPACFGLFALGAGFAYSVILPFSLRFFTAFATENLEALISLANYVGFALGVILPFGVVFELPLLVVLLTLIGVLTPEWLVRTRKYSLVAIFVMAAFLTPPDVVSQLFMAGPLLVLYEVSVWLSRDASARLRARLDQELNGDA